jgi:hypothetical protein
MNDFGVLVVNLSFVEFEVEVERASDHIGARSPSPSILKPCPTRVVSRSAGAIRGSARGAPGGTRLQAGPDG